jgi:hypothetical protein
MSNVVPLKRRDNPDRIQRAGTLVRQDWAIHQFDPRGDRGRMRLFDDDTQPIPAFDALLAGPVSEMDAVPENRSDQGVSVVTVLYVGTASFLSGGVFVLSVFWALLR